MDLSSKKKKKENTNQTKNKMWGPQIFGFEYRKLYLRTAIKYCPKFITFKAIMFNLLRPFNYGVENVIFPKRKRKGFPSLPETYLTLFLATS